MVTVEQNDIEGAYTSANCRDRQRQAPEVLDRHSRRLATYIQEQPRCRRGWPSQQENASTGTTHCLLPLLDCDQCVALALSCLRSLLGMGDLRLRGELVSLSPYRYDRVAEYLRMRVGTLFWDYCAKNVGQRAGQQAGRRLEVMAGDRTRRAGTEQDA